MSRVLGIETSCDETGVAVVDEDYKIVAEALASQVELHAQFGGVVPEIASRQHTSCISQLVGRVLQRSDNGISAVAATVGPGLMGSLLVGVNFAKAFAFARQIPFIPVHHLEGHIFSVFLADEKPDYPFVALIVSGGHTCLIECPKPHSYSLLGTTRDDAVGEAFDKVARLLGLPYPGGPAIQEAAREGDSTAIPFPRAMVGKSSYDFSYSGLKTAVLYYLRENQTHSIADVAASFQAAAIDVLITKTNACLEEHRAKRLVVAGGVAANELLRQRLKNDIAAHVYIPSMKLCVDNGVMIAAAGHSRIAHGYSGDLTTTPNPNYPLCT